MRLIPSSNLVQPIRNRLIILVGAGQSWLQGFHEGWEEGQYKPTEQPLNSIIHVVDPLYIAKQDKTTAENIESDLKKLNCNNKNAFYKMEFIEYIPVLWDNAEKYATIIIVSYTDTVNPNTLQVQAIPDNVLFIYYGRESYGVNIQDIATIEISLKYIINQLNDIRDRIIKIMDIQNNFSNNDIKIENFELKENLEEYNSIVIELSKLYKQIMTDTSIQQQLVIGLLNTLIEYNGITKDTGNWFKRFAVCKIENQEIVSIGDKIFQIYPQTNQDILNL